MALPIPAISDILFGNTPTGQQQGVDIWTDRSRLRDGNVVRVKVAPQDIDFVERARISEQAIKAGRAFYFWRKDRHSSHLDLLDLRITGITYSLMLEKVPTGRAREVIEQVTNGVADIFAPAVPTMPGGDRRVTFKQREWLRFWNITRESFVVEEGFNNHHIRLDTPALPVPVEFIGHFAGPVQWRHSSRNPFLAQWELAMVVHRTDPGLDQIYDLANQVVVEPVAA